MGWKEEAHYCGPDLMHRRGAATETCNKQGLLASALFFCCFQQSCCTCCAFGTFIKLNVGKVCLLQGLDHPSCFVSRQSRQSLACTGCVISPQKLRFYVVAAAPSLLALRPLLGRIRFPVQFRIFDVLQTYLPGLIILSTRGYLFDAVTYDAPCRQSCLCSGDCASSLCWACS
jgi:hypothetical protein